jgi:hypothetical protein
LDGQLTKAKQVIMAFKALEHPESVQQVVPLLPNSQRITQITATMTAPQNALVQELLQMLAREQQMRL